MKKILYRECSLAAKSKAEAKVKAMLENGGSPNQLRLQRSPFDVEAHVEFRQVTQAEEDSDKTALNG